MKSAKAILMVCILAAGICLVGAPAGGGEESPKIQPEKAIKDYKIIRIEDIGRVFPEEITVPQGTTVIWINNSKRTIELQFEGKQVTLACKSPVHFVVDEYGSFISDRIPSGSVASLCFIEKGEFHYVARNVLASYSAGLPYEDRQREFKGKVIVE